MKCKYLFLLWAIVFASCSKYDFDLSQVNDDVAKENASQSLGVTIDPNHTWNSVQEGSVTITADADLDDVARIQILTESPFGNDDAKVVAESTCNKGDVVTLNYEMPNYLTELVAACISSEGRYFVKVFNVGETNVRFGGTSNARTRSSDEDYPTSITLGGGTPSFNALRAQASMASEYKNVKIMDNGNDGLSGRARYYYVWNDGSWANDVLWSHQSVTGGGWEIENGTISKAVTDEGDLATLSTICNSYLKKTGGTNQTNGKANNWQGVAQGNAYFSVNNNYLVSTGGLTTIIPVQMNTTEGIYNAIYYYYFNPSTIAGMSSEDQVKYIKSLPKFKAVNGFNGGSKFYRNKEYLLPYYGDGTPSAEAVDIAIPKGYKIGFLNCKSIGNSMSSCKSGCIYGDGRLNYEVNHLFGHFYTAIDKGNKQTIAISANGNDKQDKEGGTVNGMDWTSPRIGVFSANNRTYMCFEDGADCNFSDMIIEIKQGTEIIKETEILSGDDGPEALVYTMCFEDRPNQADYDMNDVVLMATRWNATQIQIGVVACGAEDEVYVEGITGSRQLNGMEIHDILGIPEGTFANTKKGGMSRLPITEVVETGSLTIAQFMRKITIRNATTGQTVGVPTTAGAPPYAVIIPMNFKYPLEGQSIKLAYPGFLTWAQNLNQNKDWYTNPDSDYIFPSGWFSNN